MYNWYQTYPYSYYPNMYDFYRAYPCPYCMPAQNYTPNFPEQINNEYTPFIDEDSYAPRHDFDEYEKIKLKDYGPKPFVINIDEATKQNDNYRTALWTGDHLQLTLMSINPGEDIGLEIHPNLDQFIRIEEGQGIIQMGDSKNRLYFQKRVYDDYAIIIPAGKWHNLINTGNKPLKLYSIYAPPEHPYDTVHVTKEDAEAAEENHNYYYKNEQRFLRQTKEFTLSELAQYDGTMGKPAYVAVNGIVYDVSDNSKWSEATHFGLTAGKDLSSQFEGCHGVSKKLAKLPKVGILKG